MMDPSMPAAINILLVAGATAAALTAILVFAARVGVGRWIVSEIVRVVREVMDEDLTALTEQVADVGRQVEALDARVAEDHARTEDKIRSLDVRVARLEGGSQV